MTRSFLTLTPQFRHTRRVLRKERRADSRIAMDFGEESEAGDWAGLRGSSIVRPLHGALRVREREHGDLSQRPTAGSFCAPPAAVRCGSISFITLPSTVQDILLHLDLPHRPPRVSPARDPPQAELHLDQSLAFDLAAPEPIPEYEFDQSAPHDWDA